MTFNAASRLRSLEDRSAALGSSPCELPGMHSVPKSAVLPYASGVGGLSRRLLNIYIALSLSLFLRWVRILHERSSTLGDPGPTEAGTPSKASAFPRSRLGALGAIEVVDKIMVPFSVP